MATNIRGNRFLLGFFKKMVFGNNKTRCRDPPISKINNVNFELTNSKVRTSDGVEIGISVVKRKIIDRETVFLVICHGVGCNRGSYSWLFEKGCPLDCNICALLLDYREFGDSGGCFTMEGVNYDLDACLRYLKETYKPEKIHLYGHSLGSAIVLEYIKYTKVSGCNKLYDKAVSVSGFRSLEDVCKRFVLWKFAAAIPGFKSFMDSNFGYRSVDNILYAEEGKVLLLHGKVDSLVPSTHALSLAKVSGAALFFTKDDHVSIIGNRHVWDEILKFMNKGE